MSDQAQLKVFMSYSWTTPEHADWVRELAERLVGDGIHVILDRWDLKPGQDKYVFMEQAVNDPTVTKVLMVCDRAYAEKANGRKGGVGDETQIITSKVYGKVDQRKFLPIIAERDGNGQPYKPDYLSARLHIDLSDPTKFEEGYEDLLRDIYEKPVHTRPVLGRPPDFLMEEGKERLKTTYKYLAFKSALFAGKTTAVGMADGYLRQLADDLYGYDLRIRPPVGDDFKENVLSAITESLAHRNEFIDFVLLASQYGTDQRLFAAIERFFVRVAGLINTETKRSDRGLEPQRLIVPEMFLYAVAALLKFERYEAVTGLLSRTYVASDLSVTYATQYDFMVFAPYLEVLESNRDNLSRYRSGPTVQLMRQRANHPEVGFIEIINADYVLYSRHIFRPVDGYFGNWSFQTRTFWPNDNALPFFVNARSKQTFNSSKAVLGVSDRQDLVTRFEEHATQAAEDRYLSDYSKIDRKLMNIERIDTQ